MSRTIQSNHPTDIHVGRRIRQRMTALGMTHETLANATGVSFQQVGKWIHGRNRIAASRLWTITQALEVPVTYFFEGLPDSPVAPTVDPMKSDAAIELVRDFYDLDAVAGDLLRAFLARIAKHKKPAARERVG